jgi:anti-anti-sigma factor
MSPRFVPRFSVTQLDGSHDWLIAVGEIDLMTAQTLSVAIEIAEQHAPPCLTVDLSGVTFIDVSGLRVLLQAAAVRAPADAGSPSPGRVIKLRGCSR